MKVKNKVLFIITGFNRGGLETYLKRFLHYQENRIRPIIMIQKLDRDDLFYEDFIKFNPKIVHLPINFSPVNIFRFYSLLKREKIITVCDFRGDFSGIPLFISWMANVKNRIVFYRESVYQFKANYFKLFYTTILHRLTLFFSTKILSNSQEAFNNFYKNDSLNKKYHKVIKNGVYNSNIDLISKEDIRKKLMIPQNAFVIGTVGRYAPSKNYNAIIEIANIICNEYDNVYFLLCGANVSKFMTPKLIEYNLVDRIIMPGMCDNIFAFFNEMNVFLFPSVNEGQPNALIEAMILGIPIVTSNIPSILETVPSEMKSVLFDPDDIQSFVDKLKGNIGKKSHYNSNKVKDWSRNYYSEKKRFEEFYNELF